MEIKIQFLIDQIESFKIDSTFGPWLQEYSFSTQDKATNEQSNMEMGQ